MENNNIENLAIQVLEEIKKILDIHKHVELNAEKKIECFDTSGKYIAAYTKIKHNEKRYCIEAKCNNGNIAKFQIKFMKPEKIIEVLELIKENI